MFLEPTSPCESCGWWNWVRRRHCRNCRHDLVQHPDAEIDVEVRLDYAAGVRSEGGEVRS